MPLFIPPSSPIRATAFRTDSNQDIVNSFHDKFNVFTVAMDRELTLDLSLISETNFECDIRNSATSGGVLTIIDSAGLIDVSDDLGLVIPAGGVGELKRREGTDIFDFYGFIEA